MRMGSRLTSALRTLLHKQRVETELDMEIRSYVDAAADEKIESGISPTEARRQALAECGGLEQVKQADSGDHPWIGNRSHHRDLFGGVRTADPPSSVSGFKSPDGTLGGMAQRERWASRFAGLRGRAVEPQVV